MNPAKELHINSSLTPLGLACVYEIQHQNRPERYMSICSDNQVALEALQAVNTMSPLVQQCQRG